MNWQEAADRDWPPARTLMIVDLAEFGTRGVSAIPLGKPGETAHIIAGGELTFQPGDLSINGTDLAGSWGPGQIMTIVPGGVDLVFSLLAEYQHCVSGHIAVALGYRGSGASMSKFPPGDGTASCPRRIQAEEEAPPEEEEAPPIEKAIKITLIVTDPENVSAGTWPKGNYRVTYLGGAMKFGVAFQFQTSRFLSGTSERLGPRVSWTPSSAYLGNTESFSTIEACEEANRKDQPLQFYHLGGFITFNLVDTVYTDNEGGPLVFELRQLTED